MEFINFLQKEWAVISQAPFTFITGAFIIGAVVYAIARMQFSDRISSLNERVALRDDRIEQFTKSTGAENPDDARRLIAELEKRLEAIEPRALTIGQIEKIEKIVSTRSGLVSLMRDMASADSVKLAGQIERVFRNQKWGMTTGMVMGLGSHPPSGLEITTHTGDDLSGDAEVVVRAFQEAGIKFDLKKNPQRETKQKGPDGRDLASVDILVTHPLG